MAPAQVFIEQGRAERKLHRLDAALRHYENALAIYRSEGDLQKVAHTVRHVGDIRQEAGHLNLAEPCYLEALQIYRGNEGTSPLDLANTIRGMALLKGTTGESAQSKVLWEEAREIYSTLDIKAGVAESDRHIALLATPPCRDALS